LTIIFAYALRSYPVKNQIWQGAKTKIKHKLLLILALILMVDLAEDGCFGQAKVNLPVALAKTSPTTLHHAASGQVDSRHEFEPAHLWEPPSQAIYQVVTFKVQPTLTIIDLQYQQFRRHPFIKGLSSPGVFLGFQDFLTDKSAVFPLGSGGPGPQSQRIRYIALLKLNQSPGGDGKPTGGQAQRSPNPLGDKNSY
jgi:hypothetical protein